MLNEKEGVSLKIIATLSHPGREALKRPIKDSRMEWGTFLHRRKFLKCGGSYVDASSTTLKSEKGDLMFWGEWEPQSHCCRINYTVGRSDSELPINIHEPLLLLPPPDNALNTDPYIFGKTFYYSNCQQKGRRLNLPNHSMIIFGTGIGKKGMRFKIDTVFVVGKSQPYKIGDTDKLTVSGSFREAVLNRLGDKASCGCKKEYRLYSGKMCTGGGDDFFSFVPCKKYERNNGFTRPIIDFGSDEIRRIFSDLKKFDTVRRSVFLLSAKEEETVRAFWHYIVNKIKDSYLLGTRFDEPTPYNPEGTDGSSPQRRPNETTCCGKEKPMPKTRRGCC